MDIPLTVNRAQMLDILERATPELKYTSSLIRAKFPYRIPKGYLRWEELSRLIAFAFVTELEQQDEATAIALAILKKWVALEAPIYCISNELLRAFQQTQVLEKSRLLSGLPVTIPLTILLLPDNSILTPEGSVLDYLAIYVREYGKLTLGERATFDCKKYNFDFDKILFIGACDKSQNVWCSNVGLSKDGRIYIDREASCGTHDLTDADVVFTDGLRSLAMQVLLAIAYTPDLLSESEEVSVSVQKTKHKRHQAREATTLQPRWIGRGYKRPTSYRARTASGTHSSPRTHWRSPHPRWQPCGKGRQERRIVWIEPIQVNVGKS